jgi:hypothetical protein
MVAFQVLESSSLLPCHAQQASGFAHQGTLMQPLFDADGQLQRIAGLREKAAAGAGIDCLQGDFEGRLAREHEAHGVGELLADFGQEICPTHTGHVLI